MKRFFLLVALITTGAIPFGPSDASALTERTYKRLSKVHALMEDGHWGDALKYLESIKISEKRPYEKSIVLQTYGYLYAAKNEPVQAIHALEGSLRADILPPTTNRNIIYLLAQMQLTAERYHDAARSIQTWLGLEKHPTPKHNAFVGSIYAYANDDDRAIKYLQMAIRAAEHPEEQWYRRLLALYVKTNEYEKAQSLLEKMVTRYPKTKEYWLQLAEVARTRGDDQRALAVIELAHRQSLALSQFELLHLVQFYVYMGIPQKAAEMLHSALNDGSVDASTKNWRLLSNTWLAARDCDRALAALNKEREIAPAVGVFVRLAQIGADCSQWLIVVESTKQALVMDELDDPGAVYLLRGLAFFNLDYEEKASDAFDHASNYEQSASRANRWLAYLSQIRQLDVLSVAAEWAVREGS